MELYKEILTQALTYGEVQVVFPGKDPDLAQIVEGVCYKALQKIKAIVEDDRLDDEVCFERIEEIVCTLEEIGCFCGGRHDFG